MPDDTPDAQQQSSHGDWRPIPDPTILTTEAQDRGLRAARDYVDGQVQILKQRLEGIDRATKLLNETVNRTPTQIQTEIAHVRELDDVKFESIDQQFRERDIRSEREARDNKVAVDAAFAAQKEAAARQDESNAKAIDKSEKATTETISKLNDLLGALDRAIADKIDDLKARVTIIESARLTSREARGDSREGTNVLVGIAGVILTILIIGLTIFAAVHK